MDFSNTSTRNLRSSTVGSRSTEVQGLKVLKTPEEGVLEKHMRSIWKLYKIT